MQLGQIIQLLLLNCLFIIGLYEATEPGGILARPHDFLEKYLTSVIYKPLLGCVYCMASVWGTLFFVFFFSVQIQVAFQKNDWFMMIYWVVYIISLSGLNHLLYALLLFLRQKE